MHCVIIYELLDHWHGRPSYVRPQSHIDPHYSALNTLRTRLMQ